ncbi:MAG: hypothetical protein CLLPBCKN_007394 [Chroococcidiopsis cubana SAG 39.79]|nr:hypothetical protein [Chroococcidiopsis cubana SAG 39.79]
MIISYWNELTRAFSPRGTYALSVHSGLVPYENL